MVQYSIASAREDGTPNRVVMNGKPGYLGYSSVHLSYLKDGWISLVGDNVEESSGWKLPFPSRDSWNAVDVRRA